MPVIIIIIFICVFLMPAAVYCYDFNFAAEVDLISGIGNDLDFDGATHEKAGYGAFRVKPRFEVIKDEEVSFIGEYQFSGYTGEEGPNGGSFSSDNNNFKILDSYIDIKPDDNGYVRIGWQKVALPSFTFGSPFLNGHTSAFTARRVISDNAALGIILAHPLISYDNMPDGGSANIFAFIPEFKNEDLGMEARPYFSYLQVDHDINSPYNWASSPDKYWSYVTSGGFAVKYDIDGKTALSADAIYGDENNKGQHFFESKGGFYALLLERDEDDFSHGIYLWGSTGNKWGKLYKNNHWDYGFLPAVVTEDSFAPTRLAFKGAGTLGRDSALSSTGLGTAGFGLQVKDFHFRDDINHAFRLAYIRGTSSARQAGDPADITVVQTIAKPAGENGIMGDKDHAVEMDFDSSYFINERTEAVLQFGYIRGGFKNSVYDRDIYNIQMIIRGTFD